MTKTTSFDNAVILTAQGKYFVLSRERTEDGLLGNDHFPKFLITVYDNKLGPEPKMFFCYGMREKEISRDEWQNLTFLRFRCEPVGYEPYSVVEGITIVFSLNMRTISITKDHRAIEDGVESSYIGDYLFSGERFEFTDHEIHRSLFNKIYKTFMAATDPTVKFPTPVRFNLDYGVDTTVCDIPGMKFVVTDHCTVQNEKLTDIVDGDTNSFYYIEDGYDEELRKPIFENISCREYDDIYNSIGKKINFSVFRDESTEIYVTIGTTKNQTDQLCCILTMSQYVDNERVNSQTYVSRSVRLVKTVTERNKYLKGNGLVCRYQLVGRMSEDICNISVDVCKEGLFGRKTGIYVEVSDAHQYSRRKTNVSKHAANCFIGDLEKFVCETYLYNIHVLKTEKGFVASCRY